VVLISTDSFYKPLTAEESKRAFNNAYDFDAPSAWDWDLMVEKLRELKEGRKVEIPKYSFVKHSRLEETATVYGANVIILEVFSNFAQGCNGREIWHYMNLGFSTCLI
jgi:uridine kinase